MNKFLALFLVPSITFGEGYLSITPTHDILQGDGAHFELEGDAHLKNKWYLDPNIQLTTVTRYREANGKLDLEYRWTERFSTMLGVGYDSLHTFGNDRLESEDVHAKFKVKIW